MEGDSRRPRMVRLTLLLALAALTAPAAAQASAGPFTFSGAALIAPGPPYAQQLQINYIRPITVTTGKMNCSGNVIHLGKRLATAEGRLTDSGGKLYAHATGTFVINGPEERRGR